VLDALLVVVRLDVAETGLEVLLQGELHHEIEGRLVALLRQLDELADDRRDVVLGHGAEHGRAQL
jgi:hypothetical protein